MYETYKMMQAARKTEMADLTYNELVALYQQNEDGSVFAEIFCRLYTLIVRKSQKYPALIMEDKVSYALYTLAKAIRTYNLEKAPSKFVSYAMLCIEREFISSYHSQNSESRKIQYFTSVESDASDEESRPIEKMYEDTRSKNAFDNVDFELVYKDLDLTESEMFFIEGVLKGMSSVEIAAAWGVTPARIHIIKDSLRKKLKGSSEQWEDSIKAWKQEKQRRSLQVAMG